MQLASCQTCLEHTAITALSGNRSKPWLSSWEAMEESVHLTSNIRFKKKVQLKKKEPNINESGGDHGC
jgi:hypothetical protein